MCPNPLETADLVTFTEEILNGKLHFSCSNMLVETTLSGDLKNLKKENKQFVKRFQAQKVHTFRYYIFYFKSL